MERLALSEQHNTASELTDQLGITMEDASFLEQVLSEIGNSEDNTEEEVVDADGNVIDLTATTMSLHDIVITTEMIQAACENPVLGKIPEQDNDSTSRFSSAIWYEKIRQQTVILAGLGGIGSWVSALLGRMHPASMFIYDDDRVETVNLSGQMFRQDDVGKYKTRAVTESLHAYSGYGDVFAFEGRFNEGSQPGNIMICGFDNMEARRIFFNKWCEHVMSFSDVGDRAKCLFIDGRLAAESFQVFCIKGDDSYAMEQYENTWLFSDDEAEETICSYKQTSFCANMIASVMVNCFVNFIANQCNPLIPRDVPFFTEYDASMMFFKTE